MSYYSITLLVTFEQEDAIVELYRSKRWAYLKTEQDGSSNNLPELSENASVSGEYLDVEVNPSIKSEISTNSELDHCTDTEFKVIKTEETCFADALNNAETHSSTELIHQIFSCSYPMWTDARDHELDRSLLALEANGLIKPVNDIRDSEPEHGNGLEKTLRKSKRTKVRNRWIVDFDENMGHSGRQNANKLTQRRAVIQSKHPKGEPIGQYKKTRVKPIRSMSDVAKEGNVVGGSTDKRPFKEESAKTCALKSYKRNKRTGGSTKESFTCIVCNTSFPNLAKLAIHESTHTRDEPYKYETLEKPYIRKEHYTRHQATHKCATCGKVLTQPNQLRRHEALHAGRKFPCDFCDKSFSKKDSLEQHMVKHGGEAKRTSEQHILVQDGEAKYSSEQHIVEHGGEAKHSSEQQMIEQDGEAKHSSEQHIVEHGGEAKHSSEQHIVEHGGEAKHSSEQQMIEQDGEAKPCCDICGKMHTQAYRLKIHRAWHNVQRPYQCDKCNKSFFREDRLTRHLLTHTLSVDNSYVCETCGIVYKDSASLRWHVRDHSDGALTCKICNKVFKKISYLRYHMKFVHDGVKRVCCHVCGMQFARNNTLNSHLASHTSDRRFNCSTCGKSFKTNSSLSKHEIVHRTEKRYKCDVCQRQFGRADNLKTHMITHSSVKPHICKICGASFNHAVSMRQHMRRHHGSSLND